MSVPVRVLIADDNDAVRQALTELVTDDPTLSLAGVATSADEAIAVVAAEPVDVAVIDVRMPGGGDHAVREIRARSASTRVIAFSAYGDHKSVVGMVGSGAASYLLKGTSAEEIVEAIHRVAEGESILSREVTRPVVGALEEQLQHRERELLERRRKVERVTEALRPGGLVPVFQPILDLDGRRQLGVEALARFQVEPFRTPDVWFAEAWDVGLGADLELTALRAALPMLDQLPDDQFLSVNVSPEALASSRFAETLPGGSHPRLLVEVTEHAPVADYDALAVSIEGMRRAGMRLAIDDAGAGYASLRHILRLAPDVIKLDMSLTRNVHADTRRRALVAALVSFAAETGARVLAEGIETEEELATLRAFGAEWGQGYLLGRPERVHGLGAPASATTTTDRAPERAEPSEGTP